MKYLPGLFLCALAFVGVAHAEIYTWVDSAGVRHFSDVPAATHAKPAVLPGLQDRDGHSKASQQHRKQSAARAEPTGSADSGAADSRKPTLTEPEAGATVHNAEGTVPVRLMIGDGTDLRHGEQIIYYLDGSPIPKTPTRLTSLKLAGVVQGAHTLSAALLDHGRQLRRTAPITFYMESSTAKASSNPHSEGVPGNSENPLGAPVAASGRRASGAPAAANADTMSGRTHRPPS